MSPAKCQYTPRLTTRLRTPVMHSDAATGKRLRRNGGSEYSAPTARPGGDRDGLHHALRHAPSRAGSRCRRRRSPAPPSIDSSPAAIGSNGLLIRSISTSVSWLTPTIAMFTVRPATSVASRSRAAGGVALGRGDQVEADDRERRADERVRPAEAPQDARAARPVAARPRACGGRPRTRLTRARLAASAVAQRQRHRDRDEQRRPPRSRPRTGTRTARGSTAARAAPAAAPATGPARA